MKEYLSLISDVLENGIYNYVEKYKRTKGQAKEGLYIYNFAIHSHRDFYKTSAFVSALENRQGLKIGCLEEIAFNNKWITKKNIVNAMAFYGKCAYSQYLSTFIKKTRIR